MSEPRDAHRRFLNAYYGWSRSIYDWTRRYFLLGREPALAALLEQPWQSLVEVGPGTGRNLRLLHRARPEAALGGVDASDAMLEYARARCPFAELRHGFAEDADFGAVLGRPPERILFSYCLSMVQDPKAALANARAALAPGGEIWVVDFGDCEGVPGPARAALRAWLAGFHVEPLDVSLLEPWAPELRFGPGRYWLRAVIPAL